MDLHVFPIPIPPPTSPTKLLFRMIVGGILSQVWVEKEKWKMTNLKNDDCVLEWKNEIHLGQLSGWTICFFLYVDSDFSETHREILVKNKYMQIYDKWDKTTVKLKNY